MEDQSIYNQGNNSADVEFINVCIREVCLKGDSLPKYQKMIEKKFGADFYPKCERFVEELSHSVERKKFTESSLISLKYLAKEIHLTDETIDAGVKYFNAKFDAERKATEEEARRKAEEKARREAEEAERQRQQRIAEEKRKEEEKRRAEREAEQALWKRCLASHTKESIQQYLNRYPSGIFAARAYDEMIQIEKEEQRQKEEDRQKAEDKAKREAEEAERQRQYRIAEEKRKEEGNLSNNKNSMEETPNMKLAIWCLIVCVALILISYFFFWDSYLGGLFRLCAFILCGLFTWASTRKPFCTFLVGSIAYAILIFVMLTDKGQCGWGLLIGCGIALFIALKKMVD